MNNKPSIPGEIFLGDKEFSWRTVWNVGIWLIVAMIISFVFDLRLSQTVRQWLLGWRLAVVIAQFLAVLLWARSLARWIRGMDELQRRLTVEMLLFTVSAAFFFFILWLRLDRAKFFDAIFGPPVFNNTWGISSVFHAGCLLSFFYGVAYLLFQRRYK